MGITYGFLWPSNDQPLFDFITWDGMDKVGHLIAFTVLSYLVCINRRWFTKHWQILLALSIYGVIIELIQLYIPGRSFEWNDWFFDIVGTILGYFAFISLHNRKDSNS